MDTGQQISPERIETPDGSLFLRCRYAHARSAQVGPRRWTDGLCGIGTTSHTTVEFTAACFFGVTIHQANVVFSFLYFFAPKCMRSTKKMSARAYASLHTLPLVFLPDGTVESMSANICACRIQRKDDISPSNFQLEQTAFLRCV